MDALSNVAFSQCVEQPLSTDERKTFFVCCRLALHVLCAPNKCVDAIGNLLDQASTMYKSLEFMLAAPSWRQWVRDPAALQECGKILVVLKIKSKTSGSPAASLITPTLLEAFRGLCAAMEGEELTKAAPYLGWREFVMDIIAELETISGARLLVSHTSSASSGRHVPRCSCFLSSQLPLRSNSGGIALNMVRTMCLIPCLSNAHPNCDWLSRLSVYLSLARMLCRAPDCARTTRMSRNEIVAYSHEQYHTYKQNCIDPISTISHQSPR